MKVLVLGGGMSGLCAATSLVDHGFEVTVVESSGILGGRASSWKDKEGHTIDNALHVFFPHYVNCMEFFDKVGAKKLKWTRGMTIYDSNGKRGDLPLGGGKADLLRAFNFSTMSFIDQLSMTYAVLSASFMSDRALEKSDEITLYEWFKLHGMTEKAIDHFRPFGAGLTFLDLNRVSAKALIYWIRSVQCKEFFARPGIGFADGGLGEIYVEPAERYITERGGKVLFNEKISWINIENNRISGVETSEGDLLQADIYLSALPFYELRKVLPDSSNDYRYFLDIYRIQDAPSVSVQIWFDRKVTDMKCIAAQMKGVFNCFADMTAIVPAFGEEHGGSMVEFVCTPAHNLMELTNERVFKLVLNEFIKLFPESENAKVEKWVTVKNRQGVFAQVPGVDKYRPIQRTPYPNLYLCGDYTKSFIAAGMENACASANIAAGNILKDHAGIEIELFKKANYTGPMMRKITGVAALGTGMAVSTAVLSAKRSAKGKKQIQGEG